MLLYVDVTNVDKETEEERLQLLDRKFTLLRASGVRLKLSRCSFLVRQVEVLSHEISPTGV